MKYDNAGTVVLFFTGILLISSVPANADWIGDGMHLPSVPDFNQGRSAEPYTPPVINSPVRHDRPTEHYQDLKHHKPTSTDFRHHRQEHDNFIYVDLRPVIDVNPVVVNPVVSLSPVTDDSSDEDVSPAADISPVVNVSPVFAVPDGFDMVVVEDHTYFYRKGVFYQLNGNQLTAIPHVFGAAVPSISSGPDQG